MGQAERRPGVPSRHHVITPKDWFRIPLRVREQRERSSGPAVRCRRQGTAEDTRELGQAADRPSTVLDFFVPVPRSGAWLVLTFSTPLPEIADAQVELFDALTHTPRWS
ncbi:hypothetical protein [Streptomyces hoynatensis]|uniref:Uncharacterized protein n=1 Tax=Streptomyces hoynatensis TaxID=1141874 RepID=A0A3A9ZB43_9ACTN|nr:hypothetical protein [Streptomyces hoynatensis]RKN45550.1 hypothetical protein D7294_03450 [Streptomyces hoynatensis]